MFNRFIRYVYSISDLFIMSFYFWYIKKLTRFFFCAVFSCSSLLWLLLSPWTLRRTSTMDKGLLLLGKRIQLTPRMSTNIYPFSPSHGVSSSFSSFTLELVNPVFNNQFAIANNVDPSAGSYVWQVPVVPVGYVIHSCYVSAPFLSYI